MPVPTEPWAIALAAILTWTFYVLVRLHDARERRVVARPTPPSSSGAPAPFCGLCGGKHDYDDCPLEVDEERLSSQARP